MQEDSPPLQGGARADRGKNIVRGIGWLSIQGVLGALLGFVLLASLLRLLPSLSYGAYASLQVSVGVASTLAAFGLNAAVVKFLAPVADHEKGSGWGPAKASVILVALFSGTASLALAGAAPYLSDYFMKSPSWSWVFYLGALWLFSSSVSSVLLGILQAVRRYPLMARLTVVARFAGVGAAVAGLLVYRSLEAAILSWALYYGVVGLAVLSYYRGPLISAEARGYYRPVLGYATPLAVAAVVSTVASNADIIVVGGYLSPTYLGVYNAAVVISSLVSALFLGPLTTALFAETSFSAASPSEISRGTALALRFGALSVLPSSLLAAAMAAQLFDLFSGGGLYAGGIPYLRLITVFYTFVAVQSIAINILQGVGRTRAVLAIGAATALADIALSLSLVPDLGLAGAAYSRVTIMVVGCALSMYFLRDHLPRADLTFLGKALLSSAVPAAAVYLASMFSDKVMTIVPYTLLGVFLFLACAKWFGLLSEEDKSYLSHLLPTGLQWVIRLL
ncbi:MAG: oligosaccharide flippase family protein [Nitrososphaerota archaeon]|nr:oligosaccharide flippase family protein [Nitrososphaerota archaeon]MDG6971713.1 oligosaccharide flippase family protein [Nitrososphaerota archaeon]MDG7014935.1 oligosaccharide flippase family protein [Nitrososphaerota archaeon]WGO50893.1 MAG: oligosaccharide flippase family protein [Nitrososphaerota archaeon]